MKRSIVGVLFLLLGLPVFTPSAIPQAPPATVDITYIANEGFLVASGKDQVLIDALQRGGISMYEAPSDKIREKLETAKGSFADTSLILVSHHHFDHFNARSVALHMQNNPQARLITSEQVLDEVKEDIPENSNAIRRMTGVNPTGADRSRHTIAGIALEIFRLPHGTGKYAVIQNLGQIFTVGGRKFLHIGDAEVSIENFALHNLPEEKIDYAFIPYWYLTYEEGRALIREHIRPRHIIAMHIPPAELTKQTREIQAAFPDAIVFSHSGETRHF
jgi:L-ascorbate metabolism protein UlaG (beta-lactamase superfamily)